MVRVQTNKPVAYDSPDHIGPWGTADNNTKNPKFNQKLLDYIPPQDIRLLDIGCSGGGLVKTIIDDGGYAIGIEGSDYSQKQKRAEWATIPDQLFTADATAPFAIMDDAGKQLSFNVVTAWEFFEHIAKDQLPNVLQNIKKHMSSNGILLASIAAYEEVINDITLHQTVLAKDEWQKFFAKHGLVRQPDLERYFHFDMLRGEPFHYSGSFTIALTKEGESVPHPQKLKRLINRNRTYEIRQTLRWLCRWSSIHYAAWVAKRYAESFLPRGREFPRRPFYH